MADLRVINVSRIKPINSDAFFLLSQQYDKYFAANAVEKGGSFYVQSKIYRAKEQLDEFIKEKEKEQEQQKEGE